MDKALKHFDEFYGNVYEKSWEDIRTALLMETHKYMAVVNSFSDLDRVKSELEVYTVYICNDTLFNMLKLQIYTLLFLESRCHEPKNNLRSL